jgi:putative membrane protein insertion efficiency factor
VTRRLTLLLWFAGWPVRQALLLPIRLYRVSLGYVFGGNCRFYPTCSAYAELAIGRSGAIRGLLLTAWRVARCSPLSAGGVDNPPVSSAWRMLHPEAGDEVVDRVAGVAA